MLLKSGWNPQQKMKNVGLFLDQLEIPQIILILLTHCENVQLNWQQQCWCSIHRSRSCCQSPAVSTTIWLDFPRTALLHYALLPTSQGAQSPKRGFFVQNSIKEDNFIRARSISSKVHFSNTYLRCFYLLPLLPILSLSLCENLIYICQKMVAKNWIFWNILCISPKDIITTLIGNYLYVSVQFSLFIDLRDQS